MMNSKVSELLEGIVVSQAEIELSMEESKGRVDMSFSISSLLREGCEIEPELEKLSSFLNRYSLTNCSLVVIPNEKQPILGLNFDSLELKKDKLKHIVISDGSIVAEPICAENTLPYKFYLRNLKIEVNENLIKDILEKEKEILISHNIKSMEVHFLAERVFVKGVMHKLADIAFSFELAIGVYENKIRIDLSKINFMGIFSLPSVFRKLFLDIAKKYINSSAIETEGESIYINMKNLLPVKIGYQINQFKVTNHHSVLLHFAEPQEQEL